MTHLKTIQSEARKLLILGLPLVGGQVAQFAVHTTDTLMLGWYSVPALAQVTLGAQVLFIAFILGSGFALAVLPMVATAAERADWTEVRRVTRMGLWLSTAISLVMFVPMWFSAPLLVGMGQDPLVAEGAQTYLRIAGFGLWPVLLAMVLRSYLSALEHTGVVLWVSVGVLVVNALVNYALIFGSWGAPELGLRGAAIASLCVAVLSLVGFAGYIQYHFASQTLFARIWRADVGAIVSVTKLAFPISVTGLAESGLFAVSAFMMGMLGVLEIATHGIVLQLAALTFMIHMGFAQAATVRVGQAHSRGDTAALRMTAGTAMGLSTCVSVVAIALFLTQPDHLIGAFTDAGDPLTPAIMALGAWLLVMAAAFQYVDGAQVVALSVLRGMHDTTRPMILAGLSYWVIAMPIGWYLAFYTPLRETGVWLGLVIGLSFAAVLLWGRFIRLTRRPAT